MERIILDTNTLMIPAQHGVDIFAEIDRIMHVPYEVCIVERSMKELDDIAKTGGLREKRQVKLTKDIIKTQNIKMVTRDQETSVDDQLVALSKQGCIIATQDAALKRRIAGKIITLRQKKYLILK